MTMLDIPGAAECRATLDHALSTMRRHEEPYRHWLLASVFPEEIPAAVRDLPFTAQQVGDVSGKRELHNATRTYFDADNRARFPVCDLLARTLQDPRTVGALARAFETDLDGTYLRIEYAADTDGFWLEPHTDLGVKSLTFLYYLSDEPGQHDLGTDIYASASQHYGRAPFVPNHALVFVPSSNTWHGFEKRPIPGVRKSLIVNYVTNDWRAREQLAYPSEPVRAG